MQIITFGLYLPKSHELIQRFTFTEYQSLAVNSLLRHFVTVNYLKVYSFGNCFPFSGGVQNLQLKTTPRFGAF